MNKLPVIAGVEITTDDQGRFNLNALHKASGGRDAKRPKTWLDTKQAQELVEELRQDSALGQEILNVQKGGISPGTFAHELLAVSYAGWISPAFQLKVNQVFLDYRNGRLQPAAQFDPSVALNDPAVLRSLLLTHTEKVLQLEDQIKEIKPKAEALDRIATSDGSVCITDAAKVLQIHKPKSLFGYLQRNKWIFRRSGSMVWQGYQDKIQQGLLEHKVTEVSLSDGSSRVTHQVRVTPKGLSRLSELIAHEPTG